MPKCLPDGADFTRPDARQHLIDAVTAGEINFMVADGMLVLTIGADRLTVCTDCPHLHVVIMDPADPVQLREFVAALSAAMLHLADHADEHNDVR